MRYYKVKPEYDQTYKNPRIHDGNILIGGELYTESERIKMRFVPDKCFDVVDIPRNKTGFMFGTRFAFGN